MANHSKVYVHRLSENFTQISNEVLQDTETLGWDGIGLLSHLLSYGNKEDNFTYKSVLSKVQGVRKLNAAWDKCEQAGYILAFRKYNSNDNEYQYHFDQFKFAHEDLKALFEELYADGFVFYSKILYKKENRTLLNIQNALPLFIDKAERDELAQWIFDKIPFAQAPQDEAQAQKVERVYRQAQEAINPPEIKADDSDTDKLRKQKQHIQSDYPEYKPLFEKLRAVTKSVNVNIFELNKAVLSCIDRLKEYLCFQNPATSYGVVEEPLIWEIVEKQIELNATDLKHINKYTDYFRVGLENLTSLKIIALDAQEVSEPLSDEYFSSIDTLRKAWGYEEL